MPGKAEVPLEPLSRRLRRRGPGVRPRTGLDLHPRRPRRHARRQSSRCARRLIALGVYPFVVPFVPISGTPLESTPPPPPPSCIRSSAPLAHDAARERPERHRHQGRLRQDAAPARRSRPTSGRLLVMIFETDSPVSALRIPRQVRRLALGATRARRAAAAGVLRGAAACFQATTATRSTISRSRSSRCRSLGVAARGGRRHRAHPRGGARRVVGLAPRRRARLSPDRRDRRVADPPRRVLGPRHGLPTPSSPTCRARTRRCSARCIGRRSTRSSCTAGRIIKMQRRSRRLSAAAHTPEPGFRRAQKGRLMLDADALEALAPRAAREPRPAAKADIGVVAERLGLRRSRRFRSATIAPRFPTATAICCSRSRASSTSSSPPIPGSPAGAASW